MALEHQVGPEIRRSRHALTLLELLVVLAIIGLLLAVLFPAIQAMREAARKTSCMNNLGQVGLALQQYSNAKGQLPPGWIADDDAGYPGWGWGALILNELGYRNAEQQMAGSPSDAMSLKSKPANPRKANGKGHGRGKSRGKAFGLRDIDEAAPEFLVQQFSVYLCPSDVSREVTINLYEDPTSFPGQGKGPPNNGNGKPDNGKPGNGNGPPGNGSPPSAGATTAVVLLTVSRSSYAAVFGRSINSSPAIGDGAFYENSETMVERLEKDRTILIGERNPDLLGTWAGAVPGAELSRELVVGGASKQFGAGTDFGSNHTGGAYFLFDSTAVRFLSSGLDPKVYRALMSRNKETKGDIPPDFDKMP
jgi:prepilin-type N-terminal cleavage/methylation domain-containing protein